MPPPLQLSELVPASYPNPDSPADQALTVIMNMLADEGYSFTIPAWDGHAYLRINNAVQAVTDLTITSSGRIIWEYRTSRYPHASPVRLIAAAVELLDPGHTRPAPAEPPEHLQLTPLGSVRRALTRHGLAAAITPTGPGTGPVLTVINPARSSRGRVLISGDGELQWNAATPAHPDGGIPLPDIAATIARTLTQARHPAASHHHKEPA
jgi:hypothetical protein